MGCPALGLAVKKYGIENFEFSILIICFDSDRFFYEKEYIKKYNSYGENGYNMTYGGEGGGFIGKKHTEETKKIIKEKTSGVNNPLFGKKRTSEEIKKISEKLKGKNNPNISKKISESLKEYYKTVNTLKTAKKVEQYDLNNNLLHTYYSISEASRIINISHSTISRACNNPNYTAGGFKWKKY